MKKILKRIAAYLIDIILVSLVATIISSNSYINKDFKKYNEVYDEYEKKYESYSEYYVKLEEYYENEKIGEKEYNKLLELDEEYSEYLISYYDDKSITEEEYEKIVVSLNEKYSDMELNYSYKLLKYSIITTIINLMCILLYFVVFQYYFNGQTLGKKLMKLKVVSNNSKNLNILNFLVRSLIVNEVFFNILNIIFLSLLSKNNYIVYNQIIYTITFIMEMVIMYMIAFDKNNRGLHDYMSNTKVVECNKE